MACVSVHYEQSIQGWLVVLDGLKDSFLAWGFFGIVLVLILFAK